MESHNFRSSTFYLVTHTGHDFVAQRRFVHDNTLYVVPAVQNSDGTWWIGKRVTNTQPTSIVISAAARYYSATGDQVGVGPISPIVGQATRYWIVWSVDPGVNGLKDVTLSGALPSDARATGKLRVHNIWNILRTGEKRFVDDPRNPSVRRPRSRDIRV